MIEIHDIISIHFLKELYYMKDTLFQNNLVENMPHPKNHYIISTHSNISDTQGMYICKLYNVDNKLINWHLFINNNNIYFKHNNCGVYVPVHITILHKNHTKPFVLPKYITHPCQQIY
jgi:hypothetical protein